MLIDKVAESLPLAAIPFGLLGTGYSYSSGWAPLRCNVAVWLSFKVVFIVRMLTSEQRRVRRCLMEIWWHMLRAKGFEDAVQRIRLFDA